MKSTRAFNKRMRLYEAAENGVAAIINISPNSVIDLMEGDELTVDMITDPDDEPLEQLISLADSVIVDEVLGDNSYKIAVNVSDEIGASGLYQWICNYTNITSLKEIEDKVAPGLSSLLDDNDIDDIDIDDEPALDDEIVPFPDDEDDLDDLPEEGDFDEEMDKIVGESVSSKFAKYRKLYEDASDVLNEKGEDEDDDFSDIFGDDKEGDEASDKGDEDSEGKEDKEDKDADSDDTEDVPMTAVLLTVNKEDADKCKDEMIDAGIAEDDIEILDAEEGEDTVKIKIDVNSVHELKDYLSGKGIDLEEKIGGEIIDDEEDEEKDKDDESKDDKEKKDGDEEDSFDDIDFGDIFGDDEESEE